MSLGQNCEKPNNWNGLIGSTLSNKIFLICHPVTLPISFWFLMTPLPFQKNNPKVLTSLSYFHTCLFFLFTILMVLYIFMETSCTFCGKYLVLNTSGFISDFTSFVARVIISVELCLQINVSFIFNLPVLLCFVSISLGVGSNFSLPIFLKNFPFLFYSV